MRICFSFNFWISITFLYCLFSILFKKLKLIIQEWTKSPSRVDRSTSSTLWLDFNSFPPVAKIYTFCKKKRNDLVPHDILSISHCPKLNECKTRKEKSKTNSLAAKYTKNYIFITRKKMVCWASFIHFRYLDDNIDFYRIVL